MKPKQSHAIPKNLDIATTSLNLHCIADTLDRNNTSNERSYTLTSIHNCL